MTAEMDWRSESESRESSWEVRMPLPHALSRRMELAGG